MVEPLEPVDGRVRSDSCEPGTPTGSSCPDRVSTTTDLAGSPGTASRSSSRARCPGSRRRASTSTTSAGARRRSSTSSGSGWRRIACITNAPLAYTAAAAAARRLPRRPRGGRTAVRRTRSSPRPPSTPAAATGRWPSCSPRDPVEAVFVASDVVAFGAIAAIREAGLRVPDDISVVGFDDIALAAFFDPAPHDRPPARLRPRSGGRARPCSIASRAAASRTDPAPDRAHRAVVDRASATRRRRTGTLTSTSRRGGRTEEIDRRQGTASGKGVMDGEAEYHMAPRRRDVRERRRSVVAACGGARVDPAEPASQSRSSAPGVATSRRPSWPWSSRGRPKTGNKVKYTGTRDLNAVLTTGVASGVLPDLAGLPGPARWPSSPRRGSLKPLDGSLDLATYKAETAPALVALGTVDGKVVGRVHQGGRQGPDLVQPQVHDYAAAPPATWDDLKPRPRQQGQRRSHLVRRPRVRRRLRLAGHGLDRGLRPSPGRTGCLQHLVGGKTKWTDPAIKRPSRPT